jgi:AcrR family transcriptional regulator
MRADVAAGRGADPAATRRRILAAATRLYATNGAEGVTVRAVGTRARVTPPTIYWHFANMDALINEVIDAAFRPLLAELGTIDADAPPVERLLAATRIYKDFALASPRAYHTMFIAPDPGRGVLSNARSSVGRQTFHVLRGIVADCIESGDIRGGRAGETPESAALAIWGLVHGLVALHLASKLGMERADFERFFKRAYTILLRGLRS